MAFLSWRSGSTSPVSIPTKTLPIGRNERRGEKFKDILLFRGNVGKKGKGWRHGYGRKRGQRKRSGEKRELIANSFVTGGKALGWMSVSPGAACVSRTRSTPLLLVSPVVPRKRNSARNARGQRWPRPPWAQLGSHHQAQPFYSIDYNAKLTWPGTNRCCHHCLFSPLVTCAFSPSFFASPGCSPPRPATRNRAKQVERYRLFLAGIWQNPTRSRPSNPACNPFQRDRSLTVHLHFPLFPMPWQRGSIVGIVRFLQSINGMNYLLRNYRNCLNENRDTIDLLLKCQKCYYVSNRSTVW